MFIGIVVYMGFPSKGFEFCFAGKREAVHKKVNVLEGEGRQLSFRAVKAAG
jgi:hypothetical protein